MGIQINGTNDTISATDGGLNIEGSDIRLPSGSSIGVNGAAAQTPLDVISNTSGNGITVRGRSADGLGNIRFTSNNYATLYGGLIHNATNLNLFNERAGSLILGSNGIDRVTIDSSGRVTMPYQPAFFARPPVSYDIVSGETIIGGTWVEDYDRTNSFSNGTFTAPVSGWYCLTWNVFLQSETSRNDAYILKNGTQIMREEISGYSATANRSVSVHGSYQLAANDNITYGVYSSAGNTLYISQNPWGYACGFLVG